MNVIRAAIAQWESAADHISGPQPDGQLGAIIEVMLGATNHYWGSPRALHIHIQSWSSGLVFNRRFWLGIQPSLTDRSFNPAFREGEALSAVGRSSHA